MEGSIASISTMIAPLLVSNAFFVEIVGFDCKSISKLYLPVQYKCAVVSSICCIAHACIDHQSKTWFVLFSWILHCAFENRSDFIVLSERFAKLVEAFIHSSWDNVQEAVVSCISVHDVKLSQRRSLVRLPQEVEGACGDAFYHIPLRTSHRLQ